MYEAIDYYKPVSRDDWQELKRGELWWTCFPYQNDGPLVTRVWGNGSTKSLDITRFDPSAEEDDEESGTVQGEFLAISKYKRRPVVILSTQGNYYRDRAWKGGESLLVAPVRSLRYPESQEYKCQKEFVWNVVRYEYKGLFYLPSEPKFRIQEAVVHFDRMMVLHRSWLLDCRQGCLTEEALMCLDNWLRGYMFGKVSKRFQRDRKAYRQMVGEDPKVRTGLFGGSVV